MYNVDAAAAGYDVNKEYASNRISYTIKILK